MNRHILLIAAREFRQIASTRSFWLTLLILPAALAMGPLVSNFMGSSKTQQVMLIDPAGDTATAVGNRIRIDEQRRVLNALARYVRRHELGRADPNALWAQSDRLYSDSDVAEFVRAGGLPRALAAIEKVKPEDVPEFEAPDPLFRVVDAPAVLANAAPAEVEKEAGRLIEPAGDEKRKPVDYVVFVPREFGAGGTGVRLWSAEQPDQRFLQPLLAVLTQDLRTRYLQSSGLDVAEAQRASTLTPAIAVTTPPPGGGRESMLVRSILPLTAAYILLMSLLLSGSWMLQGLVEERSNKLIETVLACVSPHELMYGKLAGTVAVGLTMVLVWVLCGIGAAFATQGAIAEVLRPALAPLASIGVASAMIYFFVAGYLMVSMIFLAIGAMSDSFRDAQAYLTPVLLVIAMPFAVLVQAVLEGTGGIAVTVMTWLPIYTPFTMLARLGVGVPVWEIVATAALLAAFIAVEFILLGRIFRASLLRAGQKPTLAAIRQMMRPERD